LWYTQVSRFLSQKALHKGETLLSEEHFSYETQNHRTERDPVKLHESFDTYISQLGLRQTKQRKAILDAVLNLGPHVDAETIAAEARKIDTSIGIATVYRTLQLMTEAGLLVERKFSKERTQFEFADTDEHHHDHLICTQCGAIIEFLEPHIESLQIEVANNLGFTLRHHRMELYGDCNNAANCLRKQK
jgi:Fur family transcriptional regulator, ferric uptake regulator